MSIDSFNLAPAQNTQAGATTTTIPPQTTTSPAPTQPSTRKPKTAAEPGPTVAGVVVPGAALTGLISLCWLIHQFGLPAVLLGIGACAAAATAALALKGRKGKRRVQNARKNAATNRGSGGSGRSVLGGGPKPLRKSTGSGSFGRAAGPRGNKAGSPLGSTGSGRSSAGTFGKSGRQHSGLGAVKPSKHKTGAAPKLTGRGGTSGIGTRPVAGATGGKQQPVNRKTLGSLWPSRPGTTTPKTPTGPAGQNGSVKKAPTGAGTTTPRPGGARKDRKNSPAPTGKAGLLSRIADRKAPRTTSDTNPPKGTPKTLPAGKTGRKLAPGSKAARANTALKKVRTPKPAHLEPKALKPVTEKKAATRKKKGKKPATLTHKPTAHMSRMRHASYLAGVKLRKHTSKKTRMRIRRVISPARTAARTTNRLLSPPLAHAWRWGTRAFLNWHMAVGSIRYSTEGPNWLRPLAKVIHVLYRPAARAIAATGSWSWLNRWMYQHTSGPSAADRISKNTTHRPETNVDTGTDATEGGDWGGMFGTPFNPPTDHTTITTPGGNPVSEYAAPLEQAIDAVTQAGAMLLTNPAENMVGYEATLRALSNLQAAIGDAVGAAGETTRENFKVNPAVAEAYDDTASYARSLAARLDEIPVLFRTLHDEQIDNIENPTVQARKWDISANE